MTSPIKLITVVIADDHEIFRDGLKLVLTRKNGIDLMGEAENGKALIHLVHQLKPDVVVTDIKMPEMDGVEATRLLTQNYSDINVISLSMFDEEDLVVEMFEAGARGYLVKNANKTEIIEAIETVNNGQPYFSDSGNNRLTQKLANSRFNPFSKTRPPAFTPRELNVIELICNQCTNKEIADVLYISARTVEGIRLRIIEKMNVKNTVGLVIYAIKTGLFKPDDKTGNLAV
jgi:two-component system, NarL family, response regulator NreC